MKSMEQRIKEAKEVEAYLEANKDVPVISVNPWNFTEWTRHEGYDASKHGLGRWASERDGKQI